MIYLTLVGGGAFGNEDYWILESMQRAIEKFKSVPLSVKIVSYGRPNSKLKEYIEGTPNPPPTDLQAEKFIVILDFL